MEYGRYVSKSDTWIFHLEHATYRGSSIQLLVLKHRFHMFLCFQRRHLPYLNLVELQLEFSFKWPSPVLSFANNILWIMLSTYLKSGLHSPFGWDNLCFRAVEVLQSCAGPATLHLGAGNSLLPFDATRRMPGLLSPIFWASWHWPPKSLCGLALRH